MNEIFFASLFLLAYVVGPGTLIWGWVRWVRHPKLWRVTATLSFLGFLLATASAFLAISTIAFAQVHHFEFFDPLLIQIFRAGLLLSAAGFVFAMAGLWRRSATRWFAVAGAVATFAFWLLSAASE